MHKYFTKMQEGTRKDVERAFGILQAQWGIIKNPICIWNLKTITNIMMTCIIIYNMILDNEQGLLLESIWNHLVQAGKM
jgi:hypothetical protein